MQGLGNRNSTVNEIGEYAGRSAGTGIPSETRFIVSEGGGAFRETGASTKKYTCVAMRALFVRVTAVCSYLLPHRLII